MINEGQKEKRRNAVIYLASVISFFLLNIFNTYFVTTTTLNKHVVSFGRTLSGELNSFLGNFIVIFLIYVIVTAFTKNIKKRLLSLLIITIVLNIGVYLLYIFTRYYSVIFSIHDLSLFNNPSATLVGSVIIESLLDLILYYRILLFIPGAIMFVLYKLYYGEISSVVNNVFQRTIRQTLIAILIVFPLFVLNIGIYYRLQTSWQTNVARNTHTAQHLGLYSFYLYEFTGGNFKIQYNIEDENQTIEELIINYDKYNKNKEQYTNFIDNNNYSNKLNFNDINNLLNKPKELFGHNSENINGIFKDKNIVLVHLESFTYLLQELEVLQSRTPFINALLAESYVLENFYAPVGVGTSADAELSVLTGIYPTGDTTLYWDYNINPFYLNNLPMLFKDKNYYTEAIHADTPIFYNRGTIYDKLYNFDNYFSLNDFVDRLDKNDYYNHETNWVSDYVLVDQIFEQLKDIDYDTYDNSFIFPMTMMPHIPFQFLPNKFTGNNELLDELPDKLTTQTKKYLSFTPYFDEYIKHMFYDINTSEERYLDDTVYIFYGDHGVKLEKDDLSLLYGYEVSDLEARRINSQTVAFMYYPNESGQVVEHGGISIREGLFKGSQTLIRNQVDLYRSIIELFDLDVKNTPYFGVNVLSNEPSFTVDNRTYDIYYDYYLEDQNKYITQGISLLDMRLLFDEYGYDQEVIDKIKTYKHFNDLFITNNLYVEWYLSIEKGLI